MELNFITEPELTPRPREEVRIREITAIPYPDQRRIKVSVSLLPFAPIDRPNLEITAYNQNDLNVGAVSIIEATQQSFKFTLHIREQNPAGIYTLKAELYYEADTIQDTREVSVSLNEPQGEG